VTEPRDLRELLGDGVPPDEVERLRHVDALLRAIPGPPEVPPALTEAVTSLPSVRHRPHRRPQRILAVALAAAIPALAFFAGTRVASDAFDERAAIPMRAGSAAPEARATIRVGERDASGNRPLRLEVRGLKRLPRGGYYALWLAKDGEYGATCGSFRMGDGETRAEWTVSYALGEYDTWVVTAYLPDEPRDKRRPWLLEADVPDVSEL
jgi:hypothetical protein